MSRLCRKTLFNTILAAFVWTAAMSSAGAAKDGPALSPAVIGNDVLLEGGQMLSGKESYIRMDTRIRARVSGRRIDRIHIGRGEERVIVGYWMDIDRDSISSYWLNFKTRPELLGSEAHGLRIGRRLKVVIDFAEGADARVTLRSSGRKATLELPWYGGGTPYVKNCGESELRTSMDIEYRALTQPVWVFGDSYISWLSPQRWPYHAYHDGLRYIMYDHISGGDSRKLLRAFLNDIELGTPEYAVWCLGMNDASDRRDIGEPDHVWLECVQTFIAECGKRGITPVLATIPSVPMRDHSLKAQWVRDSGCRYIDFADAVQKTAGEWQDGLLSADGVHPTTEGAKALAGAAEAVLRDL